MADDTLIAALRAHRADGPGVFDGPMDSESFFAYVEQILVPTLRPATSSSPTICRPIASTASESPSRPPARGCWYLPPYSPDFNPIELCFAKLKAILRAARCRSTETLWPLLGDCLTRFSAAECRNYFRHCGYSGR